MEREEEEEVLELGSGADWACVDVLYAGGDVEGLVAVAVGWLGAI